jgi:hypothetical protein
MLHVYTRHSADRDHADNTQWRRCRCPKMAPGRSAQWPSAGLPSLEAGSRRNETPARRKLRPTPHGTL